MYKDSIDQECEKTLLTGLISATVACSFKTPNYQHAPLVNISTTQPLELVCTDFLTLESVKGGVQNKLVITDI